MTQLVKCRPQIGDLIIEVSGINEAQKTYWDLILPCLIVDDRDNFRQLYDHLVLITSLRSDGTKQRIEMYMVETMVFIRKGVKFTWQFEPAPVPLSTECVVPSN